MSYKIDNFGLLNQVHISYNVLTLMVSTKNAWCKSTD